MDAGGRHHRRGIRRVPPAEVEVGSGPTDRHRGRGGPGTRQRDGSHRHHGKSDGTGRAAEPRRPRTIVAGSWVGHERCLRSWPVPDHRRTYRSRAPDCDVVFPPVQGRAMGQNGRVHDDPDRCYLAVQSRDPRFDGWFVTAVTSTGIYCRPSCPARTPFRRNVRFLPTAAAAQRAGFRACKRCRPDATPGSPQWDVRADVVGRAMRLIADGIIDRSGVPGLAAELGYSVRQLERVLLAEVGAGPVALARAQRAQTARVLIETTSLPMADVAFGAGIRQHPPVQRHRPGRLRGSAHRAAGPTYGSRSPGGYVPGGPRGPAAVPPATRSRQPLRASGRHRGSRSRGGGGLHLSAHPPTGPRSRRGGPHPPFRPHLLPGGRCPTSPT